MSVPHQYYSIYFRYYIEISTFGKFKKVSILLKQSLPFELFYFSLKNKTKKQKN